MSAPHSSRPGTRGRLRPPETKKAAGCHPTAFGTAGNAAKNIKPSAKTQQASRARHRAATIGNAHPLRNGRAKSCFKCGIEKPLSEFYRHAHMKGGALNKCKECTRRDVRTNRASRAEYYRAYDRERAKLPHRIAHAKRTIAAWEKKYPLRKAAQVALRNAVRCGKVIPWPVCAMPECNSKPEAHHPDYSRPLDVVWLCPAHHKQVHALLKAAA